MRCRSGIISFGKCNYMASDAYDHNTAPEILNEFFPEALGEGR